MGQPSDQSAAKVLKDLVKVLTEMEPRSGQSAAEVLEDLGKVLNDCADLNSLLIDRFEVLVSCELGWEDRDDASEVELQLMVHVAEQLVNDLPPFPDDPATQVDGGVEDFFDWCVKNIKVPPEVPSVPSVPSFVVQMLLAAIHLWHSREREAGNGCGEVAEPVKADRQDVQLMPGDVESAAIDELDLAGDETEEVIDEGQESGSSQPAPTVPRKIPVEEYKGCGVRALYEIVKSNVVLESFKGWILGYQQQPAKLFAELDAIPSIRALHTSRFRVDALAYKLYQTIFDLGPQALLLRHFAKLSHYASLIVRRPDFYYRRFHRLHNRLIRMEQLLLKVHAETIVDITAKGKLDIVVGRSLGAPSGKGSTGGKKNGGEGSPNGYLGRKSAENAGEKRDTKNQSVCKILFGLHVDCLEKGEIRALETGEIIAFAAKGGGKLSDLDVSRGLKAILNKAPRYAENFSRGESGQKPRPIYVDLCKTAEGVKEFIELCEKFLGISVANSRERTNSNVEAGKAIREYR